MNISAEEFALKKANECRSSFFSNSQSGSNSNPEGNRAVSSEDVSDSSHKMMKSANNEIVYKYDAKEASLGS